MKLEFQPGTGEIFVARGEAPGKMNEQKNRPRCEVEQGIYLFSDGIRSNHFHFGNSSIFIQ
ncbi:MAG: hypothetical protein PHP53_19145 [Prolixibacteraceae bacterium]|nr:hypothetical protein [Prolixibacteraceae bacterium]